ncbi:MAG: MBL fold metallo-hydrolase [Micrococcales bacterium]|nr:MBL fold metallo-hydrolase [Micrococcales bacterium]
MLVTGFPAGPFGTNCYVIAPEKGSECIIVDPGMDAVDGVRQVIGDNRLRPVAVLLTHGHLDHTWSVVPIAQGYGIPAFIHSNDDYMLSDPTTALSPDMQHLLRQMSGEELNLEPEDLRPLRNGEQLNLAGIDLDVTHAPGHTPGSVVFTRQPDQDLPPLMFSGDVLFAGSIGRTDLPGGDHNQMMSSLRDVILPQADDMVVLPGHGPQTTIGDERGVNPFLRDVADSPRPPRKGM